MMRCDVGLTVGGWQWWWGVVFRAQHVAAGMTEVP